MTEIEQELFRTYDDHEYDIDNNVDLLEWIEEKKLEGALLYASKDELKHIVDYISESYIHNNLSSTLLEEVMNNIKDKNSN